MSRTAKCPQQGFSLIELMVGMAIGLLCTLVIATVLSSSEGMRRGTTSGADAQINGSLALYSIQRELAMAGYGFASEANALGCPIQAFFGGAAATALPNQLAPVLITQGAPGSSDQIRVIASSKYIQGNGSAVQVGYAVPTRTTRPFYTSTAAGYNVWSTRGILPGDLMLAVVNADTPCGLFEVSAVSTDEKFVTRNINAARWNPAGHPSQATQARCTEASCAVINTTGSFLINMGAFVDVIFRVDNQQRLLQGSLNTGTLQRTELPLQSDIVMLKAMYGRDTNGDGQVDLYDYTTPTTAAGWAQVLTVRVAVVARSAQYERDEVTTSEPTWDVGTSTAVAGTKECGTSACLTLSVSGLADWQHYRYKVFDTVVPLRNQRWKS